MRALYIMVLIGSFLYLSPLEAFSANGPDPVRAALFAKYAKQAKQALKAQDEVMSLNLTGHKFLKEEVEATTNFQKQFNDYLDSFGDILSIAANIYGIYWEVDQAVKNIKELGSTVSSSPANILAVAFSERKNDIYTDVINSGIQIAGDVQQLLPLRAEKGKNPKMTEFERIKCIGNVRRSLRSMNYKLRKMNRIIRYTTLLDSWYELKGHPKGTRSMREIATGCQKSWMRKARETKH